MAIENALSLPDKSLCHYAFIALHFNFFFFFLFLREILATCQITEKEPFTELVLLPHQETCINFVYAWEVPKVTERAVGKENIFPTAELPHGPLLESP